MEIRRVEKASSRWQKAGRVLMRPVRTLAWVGILVTEALFTALAIVLGGLFIALSFFTAPLIWLVKKTPLFRPLKAAWQKATTLGERLFSSRRIRVSVGSLVATSIVAFLIFLVLPPHLKKPIERLIAASGHSGSQNFSSEVVSSVDNAIDQDELGTRWTKARINTAGEGAFGSSFVLNSSGQPRIAYLLTSAGIGYASCNASCTTTANWTVVTFDTGTSAIGTVSLVLNGDIPHIAYVDSPNGDLKYAKCTANCNTSAAVWDFLAIDGNGTGDGGSNNTMSSPALQLVSGNPRITYHDSTNGDLKYAYCTSSCGSPLSASWSRRVVDGNTTASGGTNGNVGSSSSLYVDSSNSNVYVIYNDFTNTNLKFAQCTSSCTGASPSFTRGVIDGNTTTNGGTNGDVGSSSSLKVVSGVFYAGYRDSTNSALKYARCTATCTTTDNWNKNTVDDSGDVGREPALFVDSAGTAYVSYHDSSVDDLKFAVCKSNCGSAVWPPTWVTGRVDGYNTPNGGTQGFVGEWSGIGVDASGAIKIGYFDRTNSNAKYAECSAGLCYSEKPEWVKIEVDGNETSNGGTQGQLGESFSLALDSSNNPRVVYADNTNDFLKYAWCDLDCTDPNQWTKTTIRTSSVGSFADVSLRLNSSNNPRVAYYDSDNADLWYGECNSNCNTKDPSWTFVEVDTTNNVGENPSLILDSSGFPRIAYYASTGGDLKYAFCTTACTSAGNWSRVTVDGAAANVGRDASLALTAANTPHISYYDFTNGDLKYARCTANCTNATTITWVTLAIDTGGDVGGGTSLGLIAQEDLRIAYRDTTNQNLKYTYCTASCTVAASNWSKVTIDSSANVGFDPSLRLDSSNNPHVAYYDATNTALRYIRCISDCTTTNTLKWAPVSVDGESTENGGTTGDVGAFASLALDSSNLPRIVYRGDAVFDTMRFAAYVGSRSVHSLGLNITGSRADPGYITTASESLSYSASGLPAGIGGFVSSVVELFSSTEANPDARALGSWSSVQTQTLTFSTSGGSQSFAGLFTYPKSGDLTYYMMGAKMFNAKAVMGPDRIEPAIDFIDGHSTLNGGVSGDTGKFASSLALDSSGNPRIAFDDSTANPSAPTLRYAYCTSTCTNEFNWSKVTVDSSSDVGRYISLALDSSNTPHIAYYDGANSDLKYARCTANCTTTSPTWSIITIDGNSTSNGGTLNDVGKYASIALSGTDNIRIVYYDQSALDLRYAYCTTSCTTASNWTKTTVDSGGDVGQSSSIKLDSGATPHISYYDTTNTNLKYARCTANCTTSTPTWSLIVVDGNSTTGGGVNGNVGWDNAIAVIGTNDLRIAYGDSTNSNHRYAYCTTSCTTASNWTKSTVDSGYASVPMQIGIGANNNPIIAYDHFTNKNYLKYAVCTANCTTSTPTWSLLKADGFGVGGVLPNASNVGWSIGMAVDAEGTPHISYYDITNTNLKYLYGSVLFDDEPATARTPASAGAIFTVPLPSVQTINKVTVRRASGSTVGLNFTLQTSSDGSSYSTAMASTGLGTSQNFVEFFFLDRSTYSIRLVFDQGSLPPIAEVSAQRALSADILETRHRFQQTSLQWKSGPTISGSPVAPMHSAGDTKQVLTTGQIQYEFGASPSDYTTTLPQNVTVELRDPGGALKATRTVALGNTNGSFTNAALALPFPSEAGAGWTTRHSYCHDADCVAVQNPTFTVNLEIQSMTVKAYTNSFSPCTPQDPPNCATETTGEATVTTANRDEWVVLYAKLLNPDDGDTFTSASATFDPTGTNAAMTLDTTNPTSTYDATNDQFRFYYKIGTGQATGSRALRATINVQGASVTTSTTGTGENVHNNDGTVTVSSALNLLINSHSPQLSGLTLLNRGDALTYNITVRNARNEGWRSRTGVTMTAKTSAGANAFTFYSAGTLDASGVSIQSGSGNTATVPNTAVDSYVGSTGAADYGAVYSFGGNTSPDPPAAFFDISSRLRLGTNATYATGGAQDRVTTDCINNANATCNNEAAGEETAFNRGESIQASGYLFNIRQVARASATNLTIIQMSGTGCDNSETPTRNEANFTTTGTTNASGIYTVSRAAAGADAVANKWLRIRDNNLNYVDQCETFSGGIGNEWSVSDTMKVSSVPGSLDNTISYGSNTVFNKGESVPYTFYVFSVRNTRIGRPVANSLTMRISQNTGITCPTAASTTTDGSSNDGYVSSSCQITSGASAEHVVSPSTTGVHKISYQDTLGNTETNPTNTFGVSDLSFVSTSPTGAPTNSITLKIGGSAVTPKVANFGEAITIEFYYRGVRSDPAHGSQSHILAGTTFALNQFEVMRTSSGSCGATRDRLISTSNQPNASALISFSYTPASGTDQAAHDATGDQKCLRGGSTNADNFGNWFNPFWGTNTWAVSDLLKIDHDTTYGAPNQDRVLNDCVDNTNATCQNEAAGEESVFNRGETVRLTGYLFTVRSSARTSATGLTFRSETGPGPNCTSAATETPNFTGSTTDGTGFFSVTRVVGSADATTNGRWVRIDDASSNYIRQCDAVSGGTISEWTVSATMSISTSASSIDNNATYNTGFTVYNKGETVDYDFYAYSARGTKVGRPAAVTITLPRVTGGANEGSCASITILDTGQANTATSSCVIPSTATVTHDTTGDAHKISYQDTLGNSRVDPGNSFGISNLLFISTLSGSVDNRVVTDCVDNTNATCQNEAAGEETTFNRGERIQFTTAYVYGVRSTLWTSQSGLTLFEQAVCGTDEVTMASDQTTNSSGLLRNTAGTGAAVYDVGASIATNNKWLKLRDSSLNYVQQCDAVSGSVTNEWSVSATMSISTSASSVDNNITYNTGFTVYNKGETVDYDFYVYSARGTRVGRPVAVTITLPRVTGGANEGSCASITILNTGQANTATSSCTIPATVTATHTTTGDSHRISYQDTLGNSRVDPTNTFGISDLVRFDADGASITTPDNGVTMSESVAVYNLGEVVSGSFYTIGARGQALTFGTNCTATNTSTDRCLIVWRSAGAAIESTSREFSATPNGSGQVSFSYTPVSGTDATSHDGVGNQKRLTWRDTFDNYAGTSDAQFVNRYGVSNLLKVSSAQNSGLVSYWKLDEGSGILASDNAGNANSGTLGGSHTWASGASCRINSCVDFSNGASDRMTVAHSSSLNISGALTITSWVRVKTIAPSGTFGTVLRKETGCAGRNYGFWLNDTNRLHFSVTNAGLCNGSVSDGAVATGSWAHVAVTFDDVNKQARYYINGNLDSTKSHTGTLAQGLNTTSLFIGGSNNFLVDETRLYNRALSAAEITDLFNNNLAAEQRLITDCVDNANATCQNEAAGEETTFNRGERIQFTTAYVYGVRDTARASQSGITVFAQSSCGTDEVTMASSQTTDANGLLRNTAGTGPPVYDVSSSETANSKWIKIRDTFLNYIQQCDTVSGVLSNEWAVSTAMSISTTSSSVDNAINYNTGFTVYNKGEAVSYSFYAYSARGTRVGRGSGVTVSLTRVADGSSGGTCTPSTVVIQNSGLTAGTPSCTIPATAVAQHDTTGEANRISYEDTLGNNRVDPTNTFGVSDLSFVSTSPTGAPTSSITLKIGGSAVTPKVANFGEAITVEFYYRGVRAGSAVDPNHTLTGTGFSLNQFEVMRGSAGSCGATRDRLITTSGQPNSSGLVSFSYTPTSGTDQATHDTTGDQKCLRGGSTNADNFNNWFNPFWGANTWAVSDLYKIDSAGAASPDGRVRTDCTGTQCPNETAAEETVFNRGEAVTGQFYLYGVRDGKLSGKAVTLFFQNTLNNNECGYPSGLSATSSSGGTAGQVNFSCTVGPGDAASGDETGSGKHLRVSEPSTGNYIDQGDAVSGSITNEWAASALVFTGVNTGTQDGGFRVTNGGTNHVFNLGETPTAETYYFSVRRTRVARSGLSIQPLDAAVTSSDAVGLWELDEGTGSVTSDSSGNGNHGTLVSSPTWQSGASCKIGSCLGFNGANSVSVNNPAQNLAGNVAIEFWINPTNIGAGRINPIDKKYGGEFALTIETNGSMSFFHGQSASNYLSWGAFGAGTIVNGSWQHVAIVRDHTTRTIRSYYNGALRNTRTYTGASCTGGGTDCDPSASTNTVVMARGYTGFGLSGSLDGVHVYNRVLSGTEVGNLYNGTTLAGLSSDATGKVAFSYPLTGLSNADAEHSGRGRGKYFRIYNNAGNVTVESRDLAHLAFDGTSDFVNGSGDSNLNVPAGQARTYEASFRSTVVRDNQWILWKEGGCIGMFIKLDAAGNVSASLRTGNTGCTGFVSYTVTSSGTNYSNSQWHHVALVVDRVTTPGSLRLYVDGVEKASRFDIDANSNNGGQFRVGTLWNASSFLEGSVDEVRVWNTVRSSAQINDYKDRQIALPNADLRLYFKFNENRGQTVYDASGNGFNGTLGASSSSGSDDPTWTVSSSVDGNDLALSDLLKLSSASQSNLSGHWKLDEGSGVAAYDSSTSGKTGTLINTPTWQSGANCKDGSCIAVARTSDEYVDLQSISALKANTMTVSTWFKANELNNNRVFSSIASLSGEGSNPDSGFHLRDGLTVQTNGTLRARMASYSCSGASTFVDAINVDSVDAVATGQWNQAAVVFDFTNATTKLYLNGKFQNQGSVASVTCSSNFDNLWIGRRKTQNNFDGSIDDFRMYKRELSLAEIEAIYAEAVPEHRVRTDCIDNASATCQNEPAGLESVFNHGETVQAQGYLSNVRSELLASASSLTFRSQTASCGTNETTNFSGTTTDGAGLFSVTRAVASGDSNANKWFRAEDVLGNYAQQCDAVSGGITSEWSVSASMFISTVSGSIDGKITYDGVTDNSRVYNLGESSAYSYYVFSARNTRVGRTTLTEKVFQNTGYNCSTSPPAAASGLVSAACVLTNAASFEHVLVPAGAGVHKLSYQDTLGNSQVDPTNTFGLSDLLRLDENTAYGGDGKDSIEANCIANGTTTVCPAEGSQLSFDGSDDRVDLPITPLNGLNDFTFETWIRTTRTSGLATIASGARTGCDNEFVLYVNGANGVVTGGVKCGVQVANSRVANDGRWHHIALTRNGTTGAMVLYVDGIASSTVTGTTGALSIGTNGFNLGQEQDCLGGCYDPTQAFLGAMDEVRISSTIRYTAAFTPAFYGANDTNTRALWRFNEGSGTTAGDWSNNGYTATFAAAPAAPAWQVAEERTFNRGERVEFTNAYLYGVRDNAWNLAANNISVFRQATCGTNEATLYTTAVTTAAGLLRESNGTTAPSYVVGNVESGSKWLRIQDARGNYAQQCDAINGSITREWDISTTMFISSIATRINTNATYDFTVYNLGESVDYDFYGYSARGTRIGRGSVNIVFRQGSSDDNSSCSAIALLSSAGSEGRADTATSLCAINQNATATRDTTGSPHYLRYQDALGNSPADATNTFGVSNLLTLTVNSSGPQRDAAFTLLNRGESLSYNATILGVRNTAYASKSGVAAKTRRTGDATDNHGSISNGTTNGSGVITTPVPLSDSAAESFQPGWDVRYDAETKPHAPRATDGDQNRWNISGLDDCTTLSSPTGLLTLDTASGASANPTCNIQTVASNFYRDTSFNNANGWMMEARLKTTTAGTADDRLALVGRDGARKVNLQFSTSQIKVVGASSTFTYNLNTTVFHTYRVVVQGSTFTVYVDNVARLTGAAQNDSATPARVTFGDLSASSGENSKAEFDYVAYEQSSASISGATSAADYYLYFNHLNNFTGDANGVAPAFFDVSSQLYYSTNGTYIDSGIITRLSLPNVGGGDTGQTATIYNDGETTYLLFFLRSARLDALALPAFNPQVINAANSGTDTPTTAYNVSNCNSDSSLAACTVSYASIPSQGNATATGLLKYLQSAPSGNTTNSANEWAISTLTTIADIWLQKTSPRGAAKDTVYTLGSDTVVNIWSRTLGIRGQAVSKSIQSVIASTDAGVSSDICQESETYNGSTQAVLGGWTPDPGSGGFVCTLNTNPVPVGGTYKVTTTVAGLSFSQIFDLIDPGAQRLPQPSVPQACAADPGGCSDPAGSGSTDDVPATAGIKSAASTDATDSPSVGAATASLANQVDPTSGVSNEILHIVSMPQVADPGVKPTISVKMTSTSLLIPTTDIDVKLRFFKHVGSNINNGAEWSAFGSDGTLTLRGNTILAGGDWTGTSGNFQTVTRTFTVDQVPAMDTDSRIDHYSVLIWSGDVSAPVTPADPTGCLACIRTNGGLLQSRLQWKTNPQTGKASYNPSLPAYGSQAAITNTVHVKGEVGYAPSSLTNGADAGDYGGTGENVRVVVSQPAPSGYSPYQTFLVPLDANGGFDLGFDLPVRAQAGQWKADVLYIRPEGAGGGNPYGGSPSPLADCLGTGQGIGNGCTALSVTFRVNLLIESIRTEALISDTGSWPAGDCDGTNGCVLADALSTDADMGGQTTHNGFNLNTPIRTKAVFVNNGRQSGGSTLAVASVTKKFNRTGGTLCSLSSGIPSGTDTNPIRCIGTTYAGAANIGGLPWVRVNASLIQSGAADATARSSDRLSARDAAVTVVGTLNFETWLDTDPARTTNNREDRVNQSPPPSVCAQVISESNGPPDVMHAWARLKNLRGEPWGGRAGVTGQLVNAAGARVDAWTAQTTDSTGWTPGQPNTTWTASMNAPLGIWVFTAAYSDSDGNAGTQTEGVLVKSGVAPNGLCEAQSGDLHVYSEIYNLGSQAGLETLYATITLPAGTSADIKVATSNTAANPENADGSACTGGWQNDNCYFGPGGTTATVYNINNSGGSTVTGTYSFPICSYPVDQTNCRPRTINKQYVAYRVRLTKLNNTTGELHDILIRYSP